MEKALVIIGVAVVFGAECGSVCVVMYHAKSTVRNRITMKADCFTQLPET
jgi:hypothetical protein